MNTIDEKLKKAKLEHGVYNIIDGKRVFIGKTLSVVNPATGKHLANVPDVDRTLLDEAVSAAQRAFSGWRPLPTIQRKVILTSLLNRMNDHVQHAIRNPFVPASAYKDSGLGVEYGQEGLEEFCNMQVIAERAGDSISS